MSVLIDLQHGASDLWLTQLYDGLDPPPEAKTVIDFIHN